MFKKLNKFSLIISLLAISGLLFFSIGGEFLHSCVHKHSDQYSQDHCAIAHLQSQLLLAIGLFLLALLFKAAFYSPFFLQSFIPQLFHSFFNLRAPPVV